MRRTSIHPTVYSLGLAALVALAGAQEKPAEVEALAKDLELLQGTWELMHGNEGVGAPTVRSIKEIKGNRETLRRYDVKSGKLNREHSVDFVLSMSGSVRVLTFYPVGGDMKQGLSFVYKVDAENFYDIPGLLHGDSYRNYQDEPRVWHWKRYKAGAPPAASPDPAAPPVPEAPAELIEKLEALGAKVTRRSDGYSIDVRRKITFSDNEIDLVVQCPQVVDLTLERVWITDGGLAKLAGLTHLKRLILNDCPITAGGLETLAGMPLAKTLTSIGLRATKIKDDELSRLANFKRLERLDISQTAITDASLPTLQILPLKVLNVAGTKVSAEALEQLQRDKPKLMVQR